MKKYLAFALAAIMLLSVAQVALAESYEVTDPICTIQWVARPRGSFQSAA